VNKVVPQAELMTEVRAWADEMLNLSPTAIRVLKQSMNIDTESFIGMGQLAFSSLELFTDTDEAKEGITAFNEKRPPDFSPYRGA
jgi:naphthoate synthase